jgi:hypothetical protein
VWPRLVKGLEAKVSYQSMVLYVRRTSMIKPLPFPNREL